MPWVATKSIFAIDKDGVRRTFYLGQTVYGLPDEDMRIYEAEKAIKETQAAVVAQSSQLNTTPKAEKAKSKNKGALNGD